MAGNREQVDSVAAAVDPRRPALHLNIRQSIFVI